MARSRTAKPEKSAETFLRVSKEEAIKEIQGAIAQGHALASRQVMIETECDSLNQDHTHWAAVTWQMLCAIFSDDTEAESFSRLAMTSVAIVAFRGGRNIHAEAKNTHRKVLQQVGFLEALLDRLKYIRSIATPAAPPSPTTSQSPIESRKVFLVHGHNGELMHATARLLNDLGLHHIILMEQPDQGRAIIEKFEDEAADAGFAIVLMTADDVGASKADYVSKGSDALQARARQNVILELGYFAGSLGRKNVCMVYEEGVELPSDILGYAYTLYDRGGAWRLKVAKELKAAGFDIDMNKL